MQTAISTEKIVQLKTMLSEVVRSFVETMYAFKEPEFNRIPMEGIWSAAQVGSHVNKSMRLIHQLVEGKVTPVQRKVDLHIEALRQMMEDMEAKGKSAKELLPGLAFSTRTERRDELTEAQMLLCHDIESKDLSVICDGLDFPGLGQLTRYELINFAAFHIIRHAKQLHAIHKALHS